MKYYVLGYKDCVGFTKEFDTEEQTIEFLFSFAGKVGSLDDQGDNWIQHVLYGKILEVKTNYSLCDV